MKNGARTTENGVDLLRNTPYKTKLKKRRPLLTGWNSIPLWLFTRIIGFSYWFKGFRVHRIIKELYRELLPIMRKQKPVIFFDLHTGNNRAQTTMWPHELFKKNLSKRMKRVCKKHHIHYEPIPYATDGAIIEYFVEKFPQTPVQGYTLEFDVLEKEGGMHYATESFSGDVFAAPPEIRSQKMRKGIEQLAALMNLQIKSIY